MRFIRDTVYPCVESMYEEIKTIFSEIKNIRDTLFDVGVVQPVTVIPVQDDGTPGLPTVTYDPATNKFTFGIPAGTVAEGISIETALDTLTDLYNYTMDDGTGVQVPPPTGTIIFVDETQMIYVKLDTGVNTGADDWSTGIPFSVADTLLSLTDTPLDYVGAANRILTVNGSEDGISFIDPLNVGEESIQTYDELLVMETNNDQTKLIGRFEVGDTLPVTQLGDIIIYDNLIYKSLNNSNSTIPPSGSYELQDEMDRTHLRVLSQPAINDSDVIVLSQMKQIGGKNIILNPEVTRINQSDFDGVWIDGEYGYDGWLATTTGMTQVIEEANFIPDTQYTLSGVGMNTQTITSPPAGVNWTLPEIPRTATNIKLERGTIATDFVRNSYQLDLMKCQRYYEKLLPGARGAVVLNTDDDTLFNWFYKTVKYSIPTITLPEAGGTYVSLEGSSLGGSVIKIHDTGAATTTNAIADSRLYS